LLKSYENETFLNSRSARPIRVLCELIEPEDRFRKKRVTNTVVFFGSARTLSLEEAQENFDQLQGETSPSADAVERAKRELLMAQYYEDARELSNRMARWSQGLTNAKERFYICSGGGPGIMEAANRGASEAGSPSIGLNISLPFEQDPNAYQDDELSFEFHYFFIRKFWFLYLAKAMVVFPGGFGTMDELFELLTLVQTEKTHKVVPIVLYGEKYWRELINFEAMVKWGTISKKDLDLFHFSDDVDEAFGYLQQQITQNQLK
jgi:uncharacterized protein (TIGR00730 family)